MRAARSNPSPTVVCAVAIVAAAAAFGVTTQRARAGDCVPPEPQAKEVEACGVSGNNGCNTLAHLTEPIQFGQPIAGSFWGDETHRDTDFFRFALHAPSVVRVRVWSATFSQLAVVDTCAVVASDAGNCAMIDACLPPGVFEVFVSPLDAFPACGTFESGYTLQIELLPDEGACTPLVGDLDRDGAVGPYDLNMLLIAWGSTNPGSSDMNGDESADGTDLGMLLGAWTG